MNPSKPPFDLPPVSHSGRVTFRQATPEDAAELAPKLSNIDIAELAARWGTSPGSPETSLAESIRASFESWALLVDGGVEALFGLVHQHGDNVPWMRCSAAVAGASPRRAAYQFQQPAG